MHLFKRKIIELQQKGSILSRHQFLLQSARKDERETLAKQGDRYAGDSQNESG
jgi:hypothetical protein